MCWRFFSKHPTPERKGGDYGGPLGVGRELVFNDDGTIGVRPLPELIAAIRQLSNHVDLFARAEDRTGKWKIDAVDRSLESEDESGGVLLFDSPEKNLDYYFEADIQFDSPQATADVVVRTSGDYDRGYRVAIEPNRSKIAIRECKPAGGTFNAKDGSFVKGKPVQLQVFVCNNQIEAFVDGQASLSARVLNRSEHWLAIEIEGGRATIGKPLLHHFKYKAGK
ncbi:MAG: GH32 C-terminal domain-containing protein [Planctomycetota bacterium]